MLHTKQSDKRNIIIKEDQQDTQQLPDWCLVDVPVVHEMFGVPARNKPAVVRINDVVSSGNTTLISDCIGTAFDKYDQKWLVQAVKSATVQSVGIAICNETVTCDRRYIFVHLGHNQIQQCGREVIKKLYRGLIQLIRDKNNMAKIFVAAVLPKPITNDESKALIVKYNRSLSETVNGIKKNDGRVKFLPVQHDFALDGFPRVELYQQDLLMLNKQGASLLKKTMFQLAGFTVNK